MERKEVIISFLFETDRERVVNRGRTSLISEKEDRTYGKKS
jgi:hypothetical protein